MYRISFYISDVNIVCYFLSFMEIDGNVDFKNTLFRLILTFMEKYTKQERFSSADLFEE